MLGRRQLGFLLVDGPFFIIQLSLSNTAWILYSMILGELGKVTLRNFIRVLSLEFFAQIIDRVVSTLRTV
ncbi:hypothetical protein [Corynebacterium glutamicum]|uniref:Uncharacterized protein n=1 Tax=Corynebacterium glutamicum (strain ATCC 13032 / DSM 20300 / JCM 1318 / BCRC 11384 / CCUG 27702 / LMG 3730 / NBRC 12168 / NCIMB 10025 / NRRL B-2784 / 534) TaxID=196627 RepID=Q8NLX7_CORGL|nr:hypothetical protein [Corynebacterium glutamicum]NII98591.1 hypothetical protein [Corynebacterium glutamicum]WBG74389.1 hypothetical protein O5J82_13805 [Corynebacterium glutamicum]CAF20831.1 putative membrane protein [Corynebacterium glutamicum ATCC 13032]CCH25931.1 hypothetical protein WA5_2711 [Corynebacterium glutamicum K051]BAC00203.1 Hypothetical protein [Corynebacterium glutamicum ATCC 13032]